MDNNLSKPKPSNKKQRQKFEKSLYKKHKKLFQVKRKKEKEPQNIENKRG